MQEQVAEVVPLKQGLKHNDCGTHLNIGTCCRGSSIKTRIETCATIVLALFFFSVAEVVPLKQGLKLYDTIYLIFLS